MTIKEITLAINKMLSTVLKDVVFYVNKVPKGFKRPSIYIKFVRIKPERITANQINKEIDFTITYFGTADEYYNTDKLGLYDVLDVITDTFSAGILCVGDRMINIKSSYGGENDGEIYVDLTANFTEDINLNVIDSNDYKNMKDIFINKEV